MACYTAMRPAQTAAAAAFAAVLLLAGCGSAPVAQSSPSSVAAVSPSPTSASPTANATPSGVPASPSAGPTQCQSYQPLPGLCVGVIGRTPTHQEYLAMV